MRGLHARRTAVAGFAASALFAAGVATALGQESAQRASAADVNTPLSSAANIGQQSVGALLPEPLASWNGLRPWLVRQGLSFAFTYQSDPMANVSGGLRTGATQIGRVQAVANFDPEPLTGWQGAQVHASMYQIHGVGLTGAYVGSFAAVSDIEALTATRLNEIWVEQRLNDWLSLRIGQLAADTEFFVTPYLGIGIGGTFGWSPIATANLPSGGIVYPFATPAARVKITPNDRITLLAAVFDGDPAGPGAGDPQKRNPAGLNFRMSDPLFVIGEAQFKYGGSAFYPGSARVGGWMHGGLFADQKVGADGRLLSDPTGTGATFWRRGDFAIYGVLDQQVLQRSGRTEDGAYVFGRVAFAPSDRNIIDFYMDGGVSFQGMVAGRPDDQFAFLGMFSRVSGATRAFEAIAEATYSYKVASGVLVQPSVQYVIHPGGGASNASNQPIPDALVLGVRTTIQY